MIKNCSIYCTFLVLQACLLVAGCPPEETANNLGVDQTGAYLGPCLPDNSCNNDLHCVDEVCRNKAHQNNETQPLAPRPMSAYDGGLPSLVSSDAGTDSSPTDEDGGVSPNGTIEQPSLDAGAPLSDAGPPLDGCDPEQNECDDGNPCNGLETCHGGLRQCISGTPVQCDDGNPCNGLETCNFISGSCEAGEPVVCAQEEPDGFYACQPDTGTCMRIGSCLRQEPTFTGYDVGHPCDDGNPCNGQESCDPVTGLCQRGQPIVCDDQNGCNGEEICNIFTGACEAGIELICDDGNPCNGNEICDPQTGACVQGPTPQCDDGNACNGVEICDEITGSCLSGATVICDDGDICNGEEICDAQTSQCLPTSPFQCSDTNACNGVEMCDRGTGTCAVGHAPSCDDNDLCTIDLCDALTGGCSHQPLDCADGDPCTIDSCVDGTCSHQNNDDDPGCPSNGGDNP
tara:strand:+ start:5077 stop:6450 length:1374 start_codon:yes stop_codon:yes gene_type:complete